MEIRLAKTAGFCFGVNRAVELTYGLLAEGHKVATLGPLIHNPQAVEDMRRKGAQVVDPYKPAIRMPAPMERPVPTETMELLSWLKNDTAETDSGLI